MTNYKDYRIIDERPKYIIVDGHGQVINKHPTKEELSSVTKWNFKYNDTNTCYMCRKNFNDVAGHPLREKIDKKGKEIIIWICQTCYNNRPDSHKNIIKSFADKRTKNQDPNSPNAKAHDTQELACKLYGWEDLNKKYDNYVTPIDCYDPKTGLHHQVQGRSLYNNYMWSFGGFEDEWGKSFETMVCVCFNNDWKIVERIYKFTEKIVKNKTCAGIVKNSSKGCGWYEKYRVTNEEELKRANNIWKDII